MLASELIRDAYQEIGKSAAEQPISGDMTETAIRYLNNLVFSKNHVAMGYTEVTSGADEITSPAYTWMWMVKALAVKLCPQFGVQENYMQLKEDEAEAWDSVLIALVRISAPSVSGNVPVGSGNKTPGNNEADFYAETDSGILTESNQDVVVEDPSP